MDKHDIFKWYARNFAKRRFFKFNEFLFHLSVRGMGVLNYYDFKLSGEEFLIKKLLPQYDIKIVFDVGANQGDYANFFMNNSDCRIFCFEPNPETFRKLESRYNDVSNIIKLNYGLSDQTDQATIYDTRNEDGSKLATIYKDVIEDLFHRDLQEHAINLEQLDNVVEEFGIDEIDLLKIDTEGNEYKVLLGARKTLSRGGIKIIHFEFNMMNVVSRVFMKDFLDLLDNYKLYRLLPSELIPITYSRPLANELFAFQNIVAIRSDLK